MRHIAALHENRRHLRIAQHREPRPPHAAIFRAEIFHQRFLHLIRQQQTFIFHAVRNARAMVRALALRV